MRRAYAEPRTNLKGRLDLPCQNRNQRGVSRLLEAIRRARGRHRFTAAPPPEVPVAGRRILLVYLFPNLGDLLLLAPVIKALLDAGAKKVGVLVRKNPSRILKLVDVPAKLHVLPEALELPAEAAGHGEIWSAPETIEAADEFAASFAGKYDVAIDLTARSDAESRRWVMASEAPHRFGWLMDGETADDAGFTWGTTDIRHFTDRHWSRYQLLPLQGLGVNEPAFDLPWRLSASAETKADALFGEGPGPRVLLVPGSKTEDKRWPPERFATVGRKLAHDLQARIVVTGAPNEGPLVRDIIVAIGGDATPFTGRDLGTLVGAVQRADVVITNDTAPMHIAFLCGQPTIAIFTVMSALCWGPPTTDSRFVVLNAPSDATDDTQNTWTRLVHHHALKLLARA